MVEDGGEGVFKWLGVQGVKPLGYQKAHLQLVLKQSRVCFLIFQILNLNSKKKKKLFI